MSHGDSFRAEPATRRLKLLVNWASIALAAIRYRHKMFASLSAADWSPAARPG